MRVELEQVSKRFKNTKALKKVDLTINSGDRVALIGPNGSGKTTLIRVILGMLRPEGEVAVGGRSPFFAREQIADHMAYVPQIAPQTGVPVGELIDTVCRLREIPLERVHDVAGCLRWDPLEHADKAFRELSGGMKQKLLVALAMAARPSLLIMDEPSASLDADARRALFEMCGDLDPETTLLLCSHRLEEVRHLVKRIVELDAGQIRSDGPVEDFVSGLARAAVEILAHSPPQEMLDWLQDQRFRMVSPGRWVAFLPWNLKLPTVEVMMRRWGDEIDDLVVNDLQELQVETTNEERPQSGANL